MTCEYIGLVGWNAYTYGVLALSVVGGTVRLAVSFVLFDYEQLEDSSRLFLLDMKGCCIGSEYCGCRYLTGFYNSRGQKTV